MGDNVVILRGLAKAVNEFGTFSEGVEQEAGLLSIPMTAITKAAMNLFIFVLSGRFGLDHLYKVDPAIR